MRGKIKCNWRKGRVFFIFCVTGIIIFNNTIYLHAEEYEYDVLNRVTKVSYDDGSYVEYEYDSNGNILNVNVYNASPTPTRTPDAGQGGGETESGPNEEMEENIPNESEETESGGESSEKPGESESDMDDSGQGENEKSEILEFVEQVIEVVKSFLNAISQWFKSWFS